MTTTAIARPRTPGARMEGPLVAHEPPLVSIASARSQDAAIRR